MLAALSLLPLGGCVSSVYACADDGQCPDGFCESSGYCSFADPECDSGRRYGSFAANGLAGACVELAGTSSGGESTGTGTSLPDVTSTSSSTGGESTVGPTTSGVVPMTTTGEDSSTSYVVPDTSSESSSSGEPIIMRVEDGLVVHYRLNEAKGTTLFDSAPTDPPIDLTLTGSGYEWTPDGLRFLGDDATIAVSTTSTTKLHQACIASNEITVEAWVTPEAVDTNGPPRIITYSLDSAERNFSLMIGRNIDGTMDMGIYARVRVDPMFPNGTPSTVYPMAADVEGQLMHVAFVHGNGVDQIYIDGELVQEAVRIGDLSPWDTTGVMLLALGNESVNPRPLTGTIHLAATYCRALAPDEVTQNFQAGY